MIVALLIGLGTLLSAPDDSTLKNISYHSFDEKLESSINAIYRADFEHAHQLFGELKEAAPEDPRPHFFEALIPFWEFFLVEERPELAADFLQKTDRAAALGERKLNQSPGDTTTVLLLSGVHGYRSLVAARQSNYRVAISSGITGFNYTRKLLSLDSGRPDAQIGRGMFNYMAGSVPRELRWLTNSFGVRGDIETAFKLLEETANSDDIVSNDALMMLMVLKEKEGDLEEAYHYAYRLCERFPDNVIFLFKKASIAEKLGRNDAAKSYYQRIVDIQNRYLADLNELASERLKLI
ncbi:MAG: tetratricopeptide repeat protein [Balneolaceae bacterium]